MPTRNYTQETWGDNMKDRTPKFPGRVKLKPVAGQENIYDMTRADDPDDTGTPFNTRTMLQDSTGRFLRLPVSNPFVDDALRHMPDRIEPIGTVKTSPALSLGDAWLPCDGSQVTFVEYPTLCQILRNTVGEVTWDGITVGTAPNFQEMSRVVKFNGKFYVAGCYYTKNSGSAQYVYTLSVAASEQATGPYTVVHTETVSVSESLPSSGAHSGGAPVQMVASDDLLVAVFDTRGDYQFHNTISSISKIQVLSSKDGIAWTRKTASYTGWQSNIADWRPNIKGLATDGTYWAFPTARYIFYTDDPQNATEWTAKLIFQYPFACVSRLSYVNGQWLAVVGSSASNQKLKAAVWASTVPIGSWTSKGLVGATESLNQNATSVVYYSGRYWVAVDGGTGVMSSSNLTDWVSEGTAGIHSIDNVNSALLATERLLALGGTNIKLETTSDPSLGWNIAALPAGAYAHDLSADGDTVLASGGGLISYHDYSTDVRLLPTISLSDDTTTFIKAKNELDVFEAQAGGD